MAQGLVIMRRQGGFSYVIAMFLIAVLTIASVRALENTLTSERRDKEVEILWRGMAYREAIRIYYSNSPGTDKSFPQELKDLLYDPRLVRNEEGRVIGVYPNSSAMPVKQAGFPDELANFIGAKHYSDWKFIYQPR
jgi:hypothetical protein